MRPGLKLMDLMRRKRPADLYDLALADWVTTCRAPFKRITKALQRLDGGVTFLGFGGNHL
jgi:hypothetical protein